MKVGDDLTVEVPNRLASICKFYGIDQTNSLWERRLMMTLLGRHVKGFWEEMPRLPQNDDAFIVEIIDQTLDHYGKINGVRPSVESVITELMEDQLQKPIAGKSLGRLLRIYSGRERPYKHASDSITKKKQPNNSVATLVFRCMRSSKALNNAPKNSHAVLLRESYRRRNLKTPLNADK